MHLRSLTIDGFTKHTNTVLKFPKRGVVLIVGPNGAGKSSIPEAVSEVFWHKPLRKKTGRKQLRLWNGAGSIVATTDRVQVTRTSKGKVEWALLGDDATAYESPTKGQEALEAVIGEHQLWSRSRVFSSSDASHFTLARDSERKRLLELILGLDRFDDAHKMCVTDLRAAEKLLSESSKDLTIFEERITGIKGQIEDLPEAQGPLMIDGVSISHRDIDDARLRLQKRMEKEHITETVVRELRQEESELLKVHTRAEAEYHRARESMREAASGVCVVCSADIPKARQRLVRKRRDEARERMLLAEDALRDGRLSVSSAEEQAETARQDARKARELLRDLDVWEGAVEAARKRLWNLNARLEEVEEQRDTVTVKLAGAELEASELKACAMALGLTGIRANMLGGALEGIEAVSNAWLARFSLPGEEPISISLEPYSDLPNGSVKDAISLVLHNIAEPEGATGEGQDYGATSGGERRRVDISLMLGLAEVEAGASGFDSGTLWFDEVFDWLDEEGRESAFEIIAELAESACVVVITHNRQLITGLLPIAKTVWQVEGGKVHGHNRTDGNAIVAGAADRKPGMGKEKLPRANPKSDAPRDDRRAGRVGRSRGRDA